MKKLICFLFMASVVIVSCKKDSTTPSNNNSNNTPPANKAKACFTFSPNPPKAGSFMRFDASCSQNAKYYFWVVNGSGLWYDINGDPSIHTEKSFGINMDIGTYKVELFAYNDDSTNTFDTVSHTFTMDNSLSACFTINGTPNSAGSYPVNKALGFDGSCSVNADPQTCTWSFDGREPGPNDYGESVTHTFTTTGSHTVSLTVTDPSRTNSNSTSKTITIY